MITNVIHFQSFSSFANMVLFACCKFPLSLTQTLKENCDFLINYKTLTL